MAKFFFVTVVALIALQGALAKPKGKSTAAQPGGLEELAQTAQTIVKDAAEKLKTELPDSKQVVDSLTTNAQNLANTVNDVVNKINTEVKGKQPEIDSALKDIKTKLSETATKLQEAVGPEATAKANELKEKLDKGLKDAANQLQELSKAIQPEAEKVKEELESAAKSLFNQIVEVTKNLDTQVKNAVNQGKKN